MQIDLKFLAKRRKELNLKLEDVSNALGFKSCSTYLKYEKGEYVLKANMLPKLAQIFKCELDDFFCK